VIHGLREPATVLSIVVFAEEDRPTIVATLNQVERLFAQEGATEPGHGASPVGQGAVSLPRVPAWREKSYSDPDSHA
jgi:hypothetical protein